MEANVTIPEQANILNGVTQFKFTPNVKDVGATIVRDGTPHKVVFNIQDTLDAMSTENKAIIKGWYKNFAVLAINALNEELGATPITDTDIDGEAFPD